jgi:hypothetical protein
MEETEDVHPGEPLAVDSGMWADRLQEEVDSSRAMGVESHTRIIDTDQREHEVELGEGIERIETDRGGGVKIWLAGAGIIAASGGAVAAAIAIIRHRRKGRG